MIYLGLDLGEKTLGIARSDSGIFSTPVSTFRFYENHYEDAAKYINKYILDEGVDVVVLGYPKHMNDDIGIRAQISEAFKVMIEQATQATVVLWDERLSTYEALSLMTEMGINKDKQRQKKDELAAMIILQSYLNRKGDYNGR
ncbi:Holliday junction resolvase RuvX [Acholeplasma vituli]|uniref:Putative pre-16S rRNA nuclease n=1 Tax=Paracholeplasma vituli TaxID=69473 RepID=A0ABT2PX14_9MOLU|nr:Holliday junction resolvase RuvX [Paracholeplasma vituli]MCU0105380.1 Holliday junction resolvase RuvX [Paracholeplasma vituli]